MPKTRAEKPDIRFVIGVEDQGDGYLSGRYLIFTANAYVCSATGELLNPQSSWDPGHEIADLTVRAQMHSDSEGFYGYGVAFKPYSVDLANAERMVKVLRRITKRMDEFDARFGYVQDLPTFMGRLAEALGVTERRCFGRRVRGEADITGTGYRWMDVDSLRSHLTDEIKAWRVRHGFSTTEAA